MKRIFCCGLSLLFLTLAPAWAADRHKTLQFTSACPALTIDGSVIRGDRDVYHINAQEGHFLYIELSSLEHNGCLQVTSMADNAPVPCTVEEKADGFTWAGELTVSGAYNITVSPCRGNCQYHMVIKTI